MSASSDQAVNMAKNTRHRQESKKQIALGSG